MEFFSAYMDSSYGIFTEKDFASISGFIHESVSPKLLSFISSPISPLAGPITGYDAAPHTPKHHLTNQSIDKESI